MIKFNSNHILAGQIKELLSSFNLPQYRIYTKEDQEYYKKHGEEKNIIPTVVRDRDPAGFKVNMRYVPYIKDNMIQYYIAEPKTKNSTKDYNYYWKSTNQPYFLNQNILNGTRNLRIQNNIYDSYTHEYLGDYLRFKRDYEGIDLMPLYNCFSDKICNSLKYSWKTGVTDTGHTIKFDTSDSNYRIYMLPVKLFKEYTVAIDCNFPVEICCGIYGKYQDTRDKIKNIPQLTYQKFNSIIFSQPVLFDKLTYVQDLVSVESLSDLALSEQDLKMFIKVPANNDSSVVVLEGDYRRYNDSILSFKEIPDTKAKKVERTQNHTVTNFDITVNDFSHFKPITPLQLLRANTRVQYPFADRLIEYLCENVIDQNEELIDNLKRVQKVIELNTQYYDYDTPVWQPASEAEEGKFVEGRSLLRKDLAPAQMGLWENSIRAIVYDKFNNTIKANINDVNHDILGYIDKDIEKWYHVNMGSKNAPEFVSISNIDLYTDENGLYNEEDR